VSSHGSVRGSAATPRPEDSPEASFHTRAQAHGALLTVCHPDTLVSSVGTSNRWNLYRFVLRWSVELPRDELASADQSMTRSTSQKSLDRLLG
jgi:hypothetical protein